MKKVFLLAAFAGIVGASSAATVLTFAKGTVITLGDDKKGDDKKKCDKKKACCKKGEGKSCAGAKAEDKGAEKAKPETAPKK